MLTMFTAIATGFYLSALVVFAGAVIPARTRSALTILWCLVAGTVSVHLAVTL